MILILTVRCALLMLAPAGGAMLYAVLDRFVDARRRAKAAAVASNGVVHRNNTGSNKRQGANPNTSQSGMTDDDDALGAGLEYAAHVCAFLLLATSIVLVVMETAERLLAMTSSAAGVEAGLSGPLTWLMVGLGLGLLVVWALEASPLAASLRSGRHLPQGLVVGLVMFFHAAMEGCMLGLLYARESFSEIFLSVVLHNVPEGFVVGVSCFKPNDDGDDAGRHSAGEAVDDSPATPLYLAPNAHLSPVTAARQQQRDTYWRLRLLRSLATAVASHAGQALALAAVALWMRRVSVATTDAQLIVSGDDDALGVAEAFMTGLSVGSMAATVWYELLPDVYNVPPQLGGCLLRGRTWWLHSNRKKKE